MTQFELKFYLIITYLSYLLLLLVLHSKLRKFFFVPAVFFFVSALLLRLYVPIEINADYGGYANFMFAGEFTFSIKSILSEPYFPQMITWQYLLTKNWKDALFNMYVFNFLLSFFFYVWLALRKDIKFWIKIFFFAFSYVFLTYTVLRNAPAYFLFGILMYYLVQEKRLWIGYLGFLAHSSSLPALAATFLGFKKPSLKQLVLIFIGAVAFSLMLSLPFFSHFSGKLDAYTDTNVTKNFGVSIFHKIYLVAILGLNVFIWKNKKEAIYNNFYCAILLIYLILYFLNPVMGFRFSYYIIMYLVCYPYYQKYKYDYAITIVLCTLLIFLFVYNFYSNHLDLLHLL